MNHHYHVITLAGNGREGFGDGNAQDAMFHDPYEICCSNDGRVYVTDYNNQKIRMIFDNKVTTIAGNGKEGHRDGNCHEAMFNGPASICCSTDGKIYVTDTNNHRIRMIYNNKVITIAGNGQQGHKDGNALEATFCYPIAICASADGRLYVTDHFYNIIRIVYNNKVTTIAGTGQQGHRDGNALEAMFNGPRGICCSIDGILYVCDYNSHTIRIIYNNQVTTIAGNGQKGFKDGNALEAMFFYPTGISCSNDGRLYISDASNHRIRILYKNRVTTIAGNGQSDYKDGNALEAMFSHPYGVCCSNNGRLYVTDQLNHRIRMIYNDLESSLFGLALLLDMKNGFHDCQISLNNITYHLHSLLINVRCPFLFDQDHFHLIQQSNISNKSFESFLIFLYSNRLSTEHNKTIPPTMSIKSIVELVFIFDLFMNCKWILRELKTHFTKQLTEIFAINDRQEQHQHERQQESIGESIVELLPLLHNLKELLKTKQMTYQMNTKISNTEYCYNVFVHELQKRRSTFAQYVLELQPHLTYESLESDLKDLVLETSQVEAIDDESMIVNGAALTELCKFAYYNTNICYNIDKSETKIESIISLQHLDAWVRPDFVIKLSNDHDDISYHVHKLILCGRWKYFCQMIESGLKEVRDNEMTLPDDWNKSIFEKMMKYIYLNEIEFDALDDIEWLTENGKLYGIPELI